MPKKKIYLDWSDLQNFLDGGFSQEFRSAILDNYLILSSQHLVELFSGQNEEKVRGRIASLDAIKDKWWLTISNELDVYEALSWISENIFSLNLEDLFFKKTYFLSVRNNSEARHRQDKMLPFYDECRSDPDMKASFQYWRDQSLRVARILAIDRRQITANQREVLHEKMLAQRLKSKRFTVLGEAFFVALLLTNKLSTDFNFFPDRHEVEFQGQILTNETLSEIMPYTSLFEELALLKGHSFAGQKLSSKRFEGHASDMGDMIHLTAMPLVDVFTCDAYLFKHLQGCATFSRYQDKVFTKSDPEFESRIINILK